MSSKTSSSSRLYKQLVKQIESNNRKNLKSKFVDSRELMQPIDDLESRYELTEKNILGLGTSCVAFKLKGPQQEVLKVCSKKISFFQSSGDTSAYDLKNCIQPLEGYLLPMKEIIYDGQMF